MWNVLITMTTVGYGDVFPITNGGRFISIIAALWAVFFVSLFTVFIHNTLRFSESQKRSYILLTRLQIRKDQREYAAEMIQVRYLIKFERKKLKLKPENKVSAARIIQL